MYEYFRAVGFGDVNDRCGLKPLMLDVYRDPDESHIVNTGIEEDAYFEHYKSYGDSFGLMVRGSLNGERKMCIEGCYPFCLSAEDICSAQTEVADLDGVYHVTVCDEASGNEVVFLLQNVLDADDGSMPGDRVNVAGLSLSGTVLLPVETDSECEIKRLQEDEFYRELAIKAHAGDENAQTLLDEQKVKDCEAICERLMEEDFLSVVEGFLMPLDDCESGYTILGNICAVRPLRNRMTGEHIYCLSLNVAGVKFDLFINRDDVLGLPSPGMRFMGGCLLQGRLV